MKYSFIIPIYNVEKYLNRCIESILCQFNENSEIILVDDESPDQCPKICDEYANKYDNIYVIHQKNAGLSGARNAGLLNAKGDYIIFIDSDDYILSNTYEIIENAICKYPNYQMLSFSFISKNSNNAIILGKSNLNTLIDKEYYIKNCDNAGIWPVWKSVYRRTFIDKFMFPVGRIHEDVYWTSYFLSKVEKFIYIDEPWYVYINDRSGSITQSIKIKSLVSMIDNYNDLFKNKNLNSRIDLLLRTRVSDACYSMLRCYKNPNVSIDDKKNIIDLVCANKICFKYSKKKSHKIFYFVLKINTRLAMVLYSKLCK